MRYVFVLLCVAWLASGGRAVACSPGPEPVFPSNFELVELADAIVVATALSQTEAGENGLSSVTFRVERSLKGRGPARFVSEGSYFGVIDSLPADELTGASGDGATCSRSVFRPGKAYVLFLSQDASGEWRREAWIDSRDAEDYAGPNSLWVRAINFYLGIQRNPDRMAQRDALATMLPSLEEAGATNADQLLAADIRRHLQSVSPFTPTPVLLAAYEEIDSGGPFSRPQDPYDEPERRKMDILFALVGGDHPDAAPLFDRIIAERPRGRSVGYAIRFFAKHGRIRRAFEVFAMIAYPQLGSLSDTDAEAMLLDVYRAMNGELRGFGAEAKPWELDAYTRDRWPEMELSLFWDFYRRGRGSLLGPAVAALRPTDYRERPEVTLALSMTYDDEVEAWAIDEVDRLLPTADWRDDEDPIWFPLQALVVGFGKPRDEALIRAFCSPPSGQVMVVSQLGRHGDNLDQELLLRMLASPATSDDRRASILTALMAIEGRETGRPNTLLHSRLLEDIVGPTLRGGPISRFGGTIEPIACSL